MLIDDNPDDLFVVRQRVLRSGIQNPVISFEDGDDAMAHLKRVMADNPSELPGVIFLDLRMPRRGGFEILKWVRSQPALVHVPVIIVSTSALPEDANRAMTLGAAQFLSKFPAPEMLAEVIEAATRPRRGSAASDRTR
jgi:CheY-like chemotaxis protein